MSRKSGAGDVGLVGQDERDGYALTELGRSLGTALASLDQWAQAWSASLTNGE